MQSDGGLCDVKSFKGARSILSGPAGGVIGYAETSKFLLKERGGSKQEQFKGIIGFDMGGTSTDVSRYDGDTFEHIFDAKIADINTVAAGGGSRLFYSNGIFKVGPESAGASPGPVCYGRDGQLSITDANLVLGRLIPHYFPKIFGNENDHELFKELTLQKFIDLTEAINSENAGTKDWRKMNVYDVAYGFVKVANETMCRPIRNITQGKGCNPRSDILHIFGGAGGQHACAIGEKLGMEKIFIGKYAGILSAYGLSLASLVEESSIALQLVVSIDETLQTKELEMELEKRLDGLAEKNTCVLGLSNLTVRHEKYLSMRYEGTDTSLQILLSVGETIHDVFASFQARHMREFGFLLSQRRICLDQLRVRSFAITSTHIVDNDDSELFDVFLLSENLIPITKELIFFEINGLLQEVLTPVYRMELLEPSTKIEGPAVILNKTSTILIEPNWVCLITKQQNLSITYHKHQTNTNANTNTNTNNSKIVCDPVELAIFSNRFMGIAEQMGRTLQRTAVSTNIKERLDFSCAIFAPDGSLVANAPHLPVHLGSMSEAIKYQINTLGSSWKEGEVIMSNHPAAGGSHLPDITIITPVYGVVDNLTQLRRPIFYTASRGHHADVGGLTPGSMPPFSRTLLDEGIAIKSMKIVIDNILFESDIIEVFTHPGGNEKGTRTLQDNLSDIKAQVSANNRGVDLIKSLIEEYSLEYVQAYMQFIQDNAEESVRKMLVELSLKNGMREVETIQEIEYMDDGTPIQLTLTIDRLQRSANLNFEGTGYQVLANTNTPYSVTTSAIIYSMRCLVNSDIPLNQGCLKPITFVIPKNCLLQPSEKSAIVGGNVLTSQRVTDLILKAFKACAASYGCMNNLTFGNDSMSYYETIGGGSGAGPSWHGTSGVQCHMTNTRITDAEVLERRYPVLLRQFEIRKGSGGDGAFKGGDGITREFEFLAPLNVSILSERRVFAPFGLCGGQNGSKGLNLLIQGDQIINIGAKNTVEVLNHHRLIIHTPGGGGYGEKSNNSKKIESQNQIALNMPQNLGSESSFRTNQETC